MMLKQKSTILSAVSVIALLAASPVIAADKTNTGATTNSVNPTQIKAEELVGKDLHNLAGDEIGEITAVIIDSNGKSAALIASVGGFLGMGDHEVAIDWNDLRIRDGGKLIQTRMSKSELKALPEYEYKREEDRKTAFTDARYDEQRSNYEWIPTNQVSVSNLIGTDVTGKGDKVIGEVDDVIIVNGQPKLVLSIGEFLGMGGETVVLEFDKTRTFHQRGDADDFRIGVDMTDAQIKTLPKYVPLEDKSS
ncbi:MAG: PRC-barrel domain-containing protein [Alphaproteobacteria bacterium]